MAVSHWRDVCLNECFASYAEWLWDEAKEGVDLNKQYADEVKKRPAAFWNGKLYDMGPGKEFTSVYSKGPLMLPMAPPRSTHCTAPESVTPFTSQ